jgi:protein TonB
MKYPSIARRNGWQGKVLVSFVIMDDGKIENVSIVESSGFNLLDKNAVSTIRRAAPFPRPPTRITIVVPIFYDLS